MIEFFLTFVFFLAVVAVMAIGVMRGRAPIRGTCGGLNSPGVDGSCEICGSNTAGCDRRQENLTTSGLVPQVNSGPIEFVAPGHVIKEPR